MNSLLERNGYVIERNFLNNDTTSILNLYSFKSVQDQISVPGDPRDEVEHVNSWNLNSHAAFDSILFSSTEKMIQKCEVELIPTYYYARIYLRNADMNGHRDRKSCQFSASINLGQSHNYPIYIENKKTGTYTEVDLQPGDALIHKRNGFMIKVTSHLIMRKNLQIVGNLFYTKVPESMIFILDTIA